MQMVSSTGETVAKGPEIAQVSRPARALIGWMQEEEARLVLAGRRADRAGDPAFSARWKIARTALDSRQAGIDQSDVLTDPPNELADHIHQLRSVDAAAPYFGDGWLVRMADLSRVCALQPVVFWDHAEERAALANPDDIASIASVTLPLPQETPLPVQFDRPRMTWLITSRNPNLKFVGEFSGQVQPGIIAFGFAVKVMASFVQVVSHRGRLLLRDGYHRSLGLIARGIRRAPVFFKEFSPYQDLGIGSGMLSPEAYLGDRPPAIGDYLDKEVAAAVDLPASQKMLVVHGLELNPIG
jgi:hypothetical protein